MTPRAQTIIGLMWVGLLATLAVLAALTVPPPADVLAQEAPSAPSAPDTPSAPSAPSAPRAPRAPRAPEVTVMAAPEATPAPPAEADEDADLAPAATPSDVPRGWFGFGFTCESCAPNRRAPDSVAVWRFGSPPEVYSVDTGSPAAWAGLRRGDVITKIDGTSILSREGGRRFGAIRPGQTVHWTVLRDGAPLVLAAKAAERPERRDRLALLNLRSELNRINDLTNQAQLRRELANLDRRIERMKLARPMAPEQAMHENMDMLAMRRLRYAGVIGGAEVEVRGPGSVVVSASEAKDELVINTGDAVVVIRVPQGGLAKKGDKP